MIDRILRGVVVVVKGPAFDRVNGEEPSEGGVVGSGAHEDEARSGVVVFAPDAGVAVDGAVRGWGVERCTEGVVAVGCGAGAAGVRFGGEVAVAVVVEVADG